MIVYLCGPINGCTDEECKDWREYAKSWLNSTLDPMDRDYRGKEGDFYEELVENDKKDIDESDVLLVNYVKPSVGTSMEILYAWESGDKEIVLVHREEENLSPWLLYHTHQRFTSFEDALKYVKELEQ